MTSQSFVPSSPGSFLAILFFHKTNTHDQCTHDLGIEEIGGILPEEIREIA
jgi:hypothetical protein